MNRFFLGIGLVALLVAWATIFGPSRANGPAPAQPAATPVAAIPTLRTQPSPARRQQEEWDDDLTGYSGLVDYEEDQVSDHRSTARNVCAGLLGSALVLLVAAGAVVHWNRNAPPPPPSPLAMAVDVSTDFGNGNNYVMYLSLLDWRNTGLGSFPYGLVYGVVWICAVTLTWFFSLCALATEPKVMATLSFVIGTLLVPIVWFLATSASVSARTRSVLALAFVLTALFQIYALLGARTAGSFLPVAAFLGWIGTAVICLSLSVSPSEGDKAENDDTDNTASPDASTDEEEKSNCSSSVAEFDVRDQSIDSDPYIENNSIERVYPNNVEL